MTNSRKKKKTAKTARAANARVLASRAKPKVGHTAGSRRNAHHTDTAVRTRRLVVRTQAALAENAEDSEDERRPLGDLVVALAHSRAGSRRAACAALERRAEGGGVRDCARLGLEPRLFFADIWIWVGALRGGVRYWGFWGYIGCVGDGGGEGAPLDCAQ